MGDLLLPRPDNLRGRYGAYVTGDVYNICDRLKEIDERLCIQILDPPVEVLGTTYPFAVAELCADGVERLVMRVLELDARIITSVQRMLHVPFEKRFAEMEKLEAKWEADERERQLDELYEKMGGNMRIQLERCGFTDSWGPKYRPMNRTARRHRSAVGA